MVGGRRCVQAPQTASPTVVLRIRATMRPYNPYPLAPIAGNIAIQLTITSLSGQPTASTRRIGMTHAKIKIRTIETNTLDSYRYARTHWHQLSVWHLEWQLTASPTIPMAYPAARPVNPHAVRQLSPLPPNSASTNRDRQQGGRIPQRGHRVQWARLT